MDGGSVAYRSISLRATLADGEFIGADDIDVSHCAIDPRLCRDGDLFVAVADESGDGHEHVRTATALGAKAIVASRPVDSAGAPVCYVPDTRVAYGRICQALAGDPSKRLKTIGIAGSFGKTTTSCLTASILTAAKKPTGILGTLGYSDGVELSDARWTTPPPNVLAAWLARTAENGCSHALAEISGRGLMQSRLAGTMLDCLCVTNLRGNCRDQGEIDCRRAASRMLEHLAPEGMLIVNADDEASKLALDRHSGPMLTYGLTVTAEITGEIVERHRSEQTFLLSVGDETIPVRTSLVGRHNVSNCLAAAAVGVVYGIEPTTIARGLETVRDVPGRLERLECGQSFGVFIDEGLSPEALETCLESLREITEGRLLCVFNAAPRHHRETRVRLARAVDRWCDRVFATPPTPWASAGELESFRADVMTGFRDAGKCAAIDDRADAVRLALEQARVGDCVLVAGQDLQVASDRETDGWDDRRLARQVLYGLRDDSAEPRRRAA